MARVVKAKLPWHVIATGYTPEDFVSMGRGDAFIQPGCTEDDVSWFETEEQAMQHPAARERVPKLKEAKALKMIDGESELDRGDMHTNKKHEAELVKFESVTDPARLPFITAELSMRDDGSTADDIANEWWAKHTESAGPEAERIDKKRKVRKK